MKTTFKKFLESEGITEAAFKGLEDSKAGALYAKYNKLQIEEIEAIGVATKEELDTLKESIKGNPTKEEFDTLKANLEETASELKAFTENGGSPVDEGLIKYIKENSEVLKALKGGKRDKHLNITLKATSVAGDITARDAYTTVQPGIIQLPVRKTSIIDLFRRKPISGEFFKYNEVETVTRDAKFVIACATSAHTTNKTWIVRTVEMAKIRDIINACVDMLDDYVWVESELKQLVDESLKLKADFELLLGSGVGATDMLSIDTIASEFNPSNALADFSAATGTPFQEPNLEQLTDAMAAQISIFGAENTWMADTLVMNFKDFVIYRNLKDANGNKLIRTLSDTTPTIAGMLVVTNPIVSPNTCFVFDTTQGEILDRQLITIKTSFENNDNIEHETVTFVGVQRIQFHVPISRRDAFMKCSDIAAALVLITDS